MKKSSFNDFSFIGICHGETEKIFLKDVFKSYVEYKFYELGFEEEQVKNLRIFQNDESICVNNFKKMTGKYLSPFIDTNFHQDWSFENLKHVFIVIIDIEEDKSEDAAKRVKLISTNASEIINQVLFNYKKDEAMDYSNFFHSSVLIWHKKGIETALKIPLTEKNKPENIRKWLSKIKQTWESSNDIRKTFISFKNSSNINELFDFIDGLLQDLTSEG